MGSDVSLDTRVWRSVGLAVRKGKWQEGEVPVTVKYPDRDDYPDFYWISYLRDASVDALKEIEEAIYYAPNGHWLNKINLESFVDWYLVNELCHNNEVRHPKSCYYYIRNGVMYAGPAWDFDFGTFITTDATSSSLYLKSSLYYFQLFPQPEFRKRLKARWNYLRPRFESLTTYIDEQADWIRSSEKQNHEMWPCYPNSQGTAESNWMVNMDEDLSFQEAVDKMKEAIRVRIQTLDEQLAQLE